MPSDDKKTTLGGQVSSLPFQTVSSSIDVPPQENPNINSLPPKLVEQPTGFQKGEPSLKIWGEKAKEEVSSPVFSQPESVAPKTDIALPSEVVNEPAPTVLPTSLNPTVSNQTYSPKGGGLKKVLFIVIALLLVIVLAFVIKNVLSKVNKSKEITLTWWGLWEEENVIKPLIVEYQNKNPNVRINFVRNSPQDYRERLSNAIAKGQGPDLFIFHNTWVPMFAKELDPIPSSIMTASDFTQKYYPVVVSDMSSGNSFLGLPLGYDALNLFINEDLFANAQLEPPKTWVELRETAKTLTKIENDQIVQAGVALGSVSNVEHWQDILGLMLIQNRANLSKPEGAKVEDALKFFCAFSKIDSVWDETLPPSTIFFANGKLAMYFGPSWRALNIKELNPDLRFKAVPLPQLPKEDPEEEDISYATYWLQGVWSRGLNKTQAWEFIKFMASKESLESMYQKASQSRAFGQAYPLVELQEQLVNNQYLGPMMKLAPSARSWYLASRTFDGPTGINSQIGKYFEDATNAICSGVQPAQAMESLTPGVEQVLSQYSLVKK